MTRYPDIIAQIHIRADLVEENIRDIIEAWPDPGGLPERIQAEAEAASSHLERALGIYREARLDYTATIARRNQPRLGFIKDLD